MQIVGELKDQSIIIKKPKDVGRLYNKSRIGTPLKENKLKLTLLEGLFLLGENKIKIYKNKKEIETEQLIQQASEKIPAFETIYLAYKDLRNRGQTIRQSNEKVIDLETCKLHTKEKQSNIIIFSERDILDFSKITKIAKTIKNKNLWFSIVDEEGDITYYDVALTNLKGKTTESKYPTSTGFLLENRILIFNEPLKNDLLEKEFYGKPFGELLQLSLVEALYLVEKNILNIKHMKNKKDLSKTDFINHIQKLQPDIENRLTVFRDLKKRGLIVKTGFKFGSHFRAYTKKPDETHAEYLVHVIPKNYMCSCAELSRAVRLAHSVNKEIVFAQTSDKIDYIKFGRLRP